MIIDNGEELLEKYNDLNNFKELVCSVFEKIYQQKKFYSEFYLLPQEEAMTQFENTCLSIYSFIDTINHELIEECLDREYELEGISKKMRHPVVVDCIFDCLKEACEKFECVDYLFDLSNNQKLYYFNHFNQNN